MTDRAERGPRFKGNVVPLEGKRIPFAGSRFDGSLPSPPPVATPVLLKAVRTTPHFSTNEKAYYREILKAFISTRRLTVEALRNMIMELEDRKLTEERTGRSVDADTELERDTRLTYDLFKKYIAQKTSLGDDKFFFVYRFVNTHIPYEERRHLNAAAAATRREYHADALRDMFLSTQLEGLCETLFPKRRLALLVIEVDQPDWKASKSEELSPRYQGHYVVSIGHVERGVGTITVLVGAANPVVASLRSEEIDKHYRLTDDSFVVVADGYIVLREASATTDPAVGTGELTFNFGAILTQRFFAVEPGRGYWGREIRELYLSFNVPRSKLITALVPQDLEPMSLSGQIYTDNPAHHWGDETSTWRTQFRTISIEPEGPELDVLSKLEHPASDVV